MRRAERVASSSAVVTWSDDPGQLVERAEAPGEVALGLGATDDLLDQPGVLQAAGDVVGDEQDDRVGRDDRVVRLPAQDRARR